MWARLVRVGVAMAFLAGFLVWFSSLPETGPLRGIAALGCILAGAIAYLNLVQLVGEPLASHRARHPHRLIAAVQRDAKLGLPQDEAVEDACKCILLGHDATVQPLWRGLTVVGTKKFRNFRVTSAFAGR